MDDQRSLRTAAVIHPLDLCGLQAGWSSNKTTAQACSKQLVAYLQGLARGGLSMDSQEVVEADMAQER